MIKLDHIHHRIPCIVSDVVDLIDGLISIYIMHTTIVQSFLCRTKLVHILSRCSSESSLREAERYCFQIQTVSCIRIWCLPDSHSSNQLAMCWFIYFVPLTCWSYWSISKWNKMYFSVFQKRSLILTNYTIRVFTNPHPTLPLGESYQWKVMTSRLHHQT